MAAWLGSGVGVSQVTGGLTKAPNWVALMKGDVLIATPNCADVSCCAWKC